MKKYLFLLWALLFVCINGVSVFAVEGFQFNGTIYDGNGNLVNGTNITVLVRNETWGQTWFNSTYTDTSGWFNITLPNSTLYMYQLTIYRYNQTIKAVDLIGQSLPAFPYTEFSRLSNVSFYLQEAATINITAINRSNAKTTFSYQVKDTNLGYPISSCVSTASSKETLCFVPKDRNYSIMVYPNRPDSETNFVPVSFSWTNFTSTASYNVTGKDGSNLSNYNGTSRILHKQFNISESFARISGYINTTLWNITGWNEFTVVPFLSEPGSMIFMSQGVLPWNASSWNQQSDLYTLSSGFYNISVPYAPAETVDYILFAAATNKSNFYGGYRNITVSGSIGNFNFTMYGLFNNTENNISMNNAGGVGTVLVNTSRQRIYLANSSGSLMSQTSAHIEATVDYSSYGCKEFTFMEDISPQSSASFSLPLLNVTGVKEINVYSQQYSPKRTERTASQVVSNNNITLSSFNPGDIEGILSTSSITIVLYKSNSSCDVPSPASNCIIGSSASLANFNPLSAVIGGGKLSFRMGSGNMTVHYVNVDLLASGPPDVLFDSQPNESSSAAGAGFSEAFRFGSAGPKIYDYVIMSRGYNQSTGGLNESAQINASIPEFYDDNWNVLWNATNGTNASSLAANMSHYSERISEWQVLMSGVICTTNVTAFNATNACYLDTSSNLIWTRIPHFSGTGASISGSSPSVAAAASTDGSGGGGGEAAKTYTISAKQLEEGYTQKLEINDKLKINISSEWHYVRIAKVTNTSVTINVSSTVQQKTFSIGDTYYFDVNSDETYDLEIVLNDIDKTNKKANITVTQTSGAVAPENTNDRVTGGAVDGGATTSTGNDGTTTTGTNSTKKISSSTLWILILVLVAIILVGVWLFIRKPKQHTR